MTNSGTSPNSVSANNHDLGEIKLDKPKIHVNAGTTENVNGITNKKKVESNSKNRNGKQSKGDIGAKDDCIPFDVCCQLFVSGK